MHEWIVPVDSTPKGCGWTTTYVMSLKADSAEDARKLAHDLICDWLDANNVYVGKFIVGRPRFQPPAGQG